MIKLQAFLFENFKDRRQRLNESVGISSVAQNIVKQVELVGMREKRLHGRLKVQNTVGSSMKYPVLCEYTTRCVEWLSFLRISSTKKLPVPLNEIEHEECLRFGGFGQHWICKRHWPDILLRLLVCRMKIDCETKLVRSLLRSSKWTQAHLDEILRNM